MILKNVKLVWTSLYTPKLNKLNDKEEYVTTIIINKNDTETIKEFNETVKACLATQAPQMQKNAKVPKLKDGDSLEDNLKDYDFLKNSYFYTLKNKKQPDLNKAIVQNGSIIKIPAQEGDIYAGCTAVVFANPFFYNSNANKGVTFYLNEVIKTRDGVRLGKEDIKLDFDDLGLSENEISNDDTGWESL